MTKDLSDRVGKIEQRNRKVEFDKAWESSWTRKICIAILTYVVVWIYLKFVVHVDPWINALVPTMGFLLSTLTLSWVKLWWIERHGIKKDS